MLVGGALRALRFSQAAHGARSQLLRSPSGDVVKRRDFRNLLAEIVDLTILVTPASLKRRRGRGLIAALSEANFYWENHQPKYHLAVVITLSAQASKSGMVLVAYGHGGSSHVFAAANRTCARGLP